MENQTRRKIQVLRTNNRGEYTSKDFLEFCSLEGIKKDLTVPHTPQQNGVAERKKKKLVGVAKAMLFDQGLPPFLWVKAYKTAVYIQNMCPTQLWGGKHPRRSSQALDRM